MYYLFNLVQEFPLIPDLFLHVYDRNQIDVIKLRNPDLGNHLKVDQMRINVSVFL